MAKSKKKLARRERKGRLPDKGGSQYGSSDDESFDTMSVMSVDSTIPRVSQENVSVEEDALTEQYFFEDRLRDCIEGALETKGSPRRWMCLDALCKGLADKYSPDFLGNRPATMTELLEKSMRRGKVEEQVTAATLAAVLVLQYGASPEGAEIQRTLFKIFITNLKDESQPPHLREKIAAALAITTLIAEEEVPNTHEVMEQFTAIFSKSCRRGEVKAIPPNLTPAEVKLHQTALQSWGLLLTVAEDRAYHLIDRNLATVTALLHSSDVDVRVAAGEVLAMMYEIARDHDSDFEGDDLEKLCEDLHMLATDSKRYRAKKERKYQRASFREIERAVRDGDKPDFNIQFGMETLKVRTWEDKRTYDAVCGILGSGMHHHLQLNPEVRTLFGLGAPLAICANLTEKLGKYERIVADRARTKRLAKCRDKRVFQFD